ncbi:PssE/Cps14G family polysaccharide biosynthesis glycosyltransferase [Clostridium perfringens]|uniref:PssE/Cps14G family polysaccharide biosynthesis glycosyltransferase n=1 Tax=Clostridium perfringens TaxID=1502 RepID=UPI0018E4C66D|nr:PssE/Cps14G family polysaccharide biosynthesis glycosyltransferase [Clostridium perfringens]MBI6066230.1 beta(1,3)galactosyltransferase EpsH [Clostridium perfringens]MDK0606744.1 PssE/Cps14G family polysaccharide biosynthesis glycosyltransferase [Clostridium perfringens]MDZ5031023.1 beta(1,3)galactosyltransferase EpsH [Clostridium perfringens]
MIFVTLGSQKFQFNRLLEEMDRLISNGFIREEVFAQIGYSDYIPKYYEFKNFLNRDEFLKFMNKCDKVVTHGGTGAIIGAVKKKKKVVAIPRNKEFNEHVDNHQYDIVREFSSMNLIYGLNDVCELKYALINIENKKFNSYTSNSFEIIYDIKKFLDY